LKHFIDKGTDVNVRDPEGVSHWQEFIPITVYNCCAWFLHLSSRQ